MQRCREPLKNRTIQLLGGRIAYAGFESIITVTIMRDDSKLLLQYFLRHGDVVEKALIDSVTEGSSWDNELSVNTWLLSTILIDYFWTRFVKLLESIPDAEDRDLFISIAKYVVGSNLGFKEVSTEFINRKIEQTKHASMA